MQNVIDAPRPAPGTNAATTLPDRNNRLSKFVFDSYSDLTTAAYEAYNDLIVFDAEKIIASLGTQLHRYTGPVDEQPFLRWARRFVTREARRFEITTRILDEQKAVILAAIKEYLWTSSTDLAVEEQDVFWEIALLVWQRAHSLDRRGAAKLSTRLTALVKKHCYFYHSAYTDRRHKAIQRQVTAGRSIGCEQLSDEELASMSVESHTSCYDPGYSECGLSMM